MINLAFRTLPDREKWKQHRFFVVEEMLDKPAKTCKSVIAFSMFISYDRTEVI